MTPRSTALLTAIALAMPLMAQPAIVSSFPVAPAGTAFVGGLEYDCGGNHVWILDQTNDLISLYTSEGGFVRSWAAPQAPGTAVTNPQPIGCGQDAQTGLLWIGDEGEIVYEWNPQTGAPTGRAFSTVPSISDVSGVAVDALTGNIYVSQDSGTRQIVEFDPTGTPLRTIDLTAAGSTDPDGLAYDSIRMRWYLGEDTGDAIIEVDAAGMMTNRWDLSVLGISPEGVGLDPNTGDLIIGDGFVTRSVYRVSGFGASTGACIAAPPLFTITVESSGAGDGTVALQNLPAGTTSGLTVFSLDTSLPVNAGPIFGLSPDAFTFDILNTNPAPSPGNPFNWVAGVPTLYPEAAFTLPPGSLSAFAGQSWDFLAAAATPTGLVPTFNVARITW